MQKINKEGDFKPFPVEELNGWLEEQLKDVDGFSATLIIDAKGVTGDLNNKFPSHPLYIDCATLKKVDFEKCVTDLSSWSHRSVLFDHITEIPDFEEKEDWEYLIRFALKKEVYPVYRKDIFFEKLQIVAKGKDFPIYLNPSSLNAVILNYNNSEVGADDEFNQFNNQ